MNKVLGQNKCSKHLGYAKKKKCNVKACNKYAVSKGVCVSHGAIVQRCKVESCDKHAQSKVCVYHMEQLSLESYVM